MAYSPAAMPDSMMPHISLTDGRVIRMQYSSGTWFVLFEGKYYAAATPETLRKGLDDRFHILRPRIEIPTKHAVTLALETLRSKESSLIECQEARQALKQHAALGHAQAFIMLELIRTKSLSKEAIDITQRLHKHDYCDVTHEELVQHVNNLVLRSKLVLELSDRLRF